MKGLFKSKPKTPADVVRQTRDLLLYAQRVPSDSRESKRDEKVRVFSSLSLCDLFESSSGFFDPDPILFCRFCLCKSKSVLNFLFVIYFAEIKLISEIWLSDGVCEI